ncbi:MAG: hypothetical protein ACUVV6_05295 [Thermoplasmatota archaeon]
MGGSGDSRCGKIRRGGAAGALALGAALALIISAAPVATSQEAPAAVFADDAFRDFGLDPDEDGLYEHLVLNVVVEAAAPDIYTVIGTVSALNGGEPLSRAVQHQYLEPGRGVVSLDFGGRELSRLGGEQRLSFELVLQSSSGAALDMTSRASGGTYSGAMFESDSAEPRFTGEVLETVEDRDGDGLYEYLNISAGLENPMDLELDVSGTLNGLLLGWGMVRALDEREGRGAAELRFDGGGIAQLGVDGPYNITIRVARPAGGELAMTHTTRPYLSTAFEAAPLPIELTGRGSDRGLDMNGDGLFDALEVTVRAEVRLGGGYLVKGELDRTPAGNVEPELRPRARAMVELPSNGSAELTLVFNGAAISALALDGPYHISITAFSERVLRAVGGEYTTGPYSPLDFAGPTPPAIFTGEVSETTPDRDNDGLLDALVLEAAVRTTGGGSFTVAGALRRDGHIIAWSARTLELSAGPGRVSVDFDGARIRSSGLSGPYRVVLYISTAGERPRAPEDAGSAPEPGLLTHDTLVHTTRPYRAASFERPPGVGKPQGAGGDPFVRVDGESYLARSTRISVAVSRARPELAFYYSADNGSSGRFRLSYTRLLAFSDGNGNGVCDPGEERYEGVLPLSSWSAEVLDAGVGGEGGWAFEAELRADVDMTAATATGQPAVTILGWARVTFRLYMGSEPVGFSEPLNFVLKGGAEMKIDILIEPGRPLGRGVTGLALEHVLSDERGLNHFRTLESDRVRTFEPGGEGANGSVFRPAPDAVQRISILGRSGREHGYYDWLPGVRVTDAAGGVKWRPVNMSYSTDGLQMRLLLNYPCDASTVSLLHDPTVGVNESNTPVIAVTVEKPPFNVLLYGLSVFAAAAVVIVIRGSQRRRP